VMHGASLRNVTLTRAQLDNVDLLGVDLSGANLTDASLDGANLGEVASHRTLLPLTSRMCCVRAGVNARRNAARHVAARCQLERCGRL
jgi:uncharacterized protein YjbI with pentapeptide repeats